MSKIEIENIELRVDESEYYAHIFISYSGVVGSLHGSVEDRGFWLFRPVAGYNDENGHIEKIHVLENTVHLETNIPFGEFYSIDNCFLSYHSEKGTITDDEGNVLPEFSDYLLSQPYIYSDYIERIGISEVFVDDGKFLPDSLPRDIIYTEELFQKCVCCFPSEIAEDNEHDHIRYFRLRFTVCCECELKLKLRSGSTMKVFENGKLIYSQEYRGTHINRFITFLELHPSETVNELVFVLRSEHGTSCGFIIQFAIPEDRGTSFPRFVY